MAKYGLVAGEQSTGILKKTIEDFGDMEVAYTPKTMAVMIRELANTGGLHIQDLKSVLILDYAFEHDEYGDINTVAEQFVAIQDLMTSNRLENVTLYLVTKNTDLYEKLGGNVAGVPGTLFENVQIFLTKNNYKAAQLRAILLGEHDNEGLYNKEHTRNQSRKERLQEERDMEIESRRNLKEELVKFDQNEPVTRISEMDYIDSGKRIAADAQKRKEAELERRKAERNVRKGKPVVLEKESETKEPEVSINIYAGSREEVSRQINTDTRLEESSLTELFEELRSISTEVANGKIETDSGVISIVGDYNAGASGIVANAAEMYAMSNRKVLIIDLDIQNRMQTSYFNQYDKVTGNQRGTSDSLIEVIQGYSLQESVVPVTKRLHILSVSRKDEVNMHWVNAIAGNLETILLEARGLYDLVILDIPFRFFKEYLGVLDKVERNIFVVENKFYKVENFLEYVIHPILLDRTEEMEKVILKSSIVLNKFVRGMRDLEGYEINRRYMRKVLNGIGYPYDNMGVVGEIPYYDDWEEQYFTGLRQVWKYPIALGVYRRVFGKVVI